MGHKDLCLHANLEVWCQQQTLDLQELPRFALQLILRIGKLFLKANHTKKHRTEHGHSKNAIEADL